MTSESIKCPCCGQSTTPTGVVVVSLAENRMVYQGESISLTPRLAELAFVLARRMPETVSHDTITAALWGVNECETTFDSIKVAIHNLRAVLPRGLAVRNTHSRGYRMEVVTEMLRSERILNRRTRGPRLTSEDISHATA